MFLDFGQIFLESFESEFGFVRGKGVVSFEKEVPSLEKVFCWTVHENFENHSLFF